MTILPFKVLSLLYGCTVTLISLYFYLCNYGNSLNTGSNVDNLTFDFIVVGAGSAGSVVARRLAEDAAGFSVLLLEAGGAPWPFMDVPSFSSLLLLSDFDWKYKTQPQDNACLGLSDRVSRWPRGKILGGTSRLNLMVYLRGDPSDFDAWEKMGIQGWSYKDNLPFFKVSENQQGNYKHDGKYHGRKGPLIVSEASWTSKLSNAFLETIRLLGYEVGDLNGNATSGFMMSQFTMKHGRRQSGDIAYLDNRPNLYIITHAHVEKVHFRGNREAFAVRYIHQGQRKIAVASKEIILSSGSIASPQILLLSGIGSTEQLKLFQIPVVAALSGVGKNLQDHITTGADLIILNSSTSDMALTLRSLASPFEILKYFWSGSGALSSTGVEAVALVHTPLVNKSSDPPDIEFMFMPVGYSADCGQVFRYTTGISKGMWNRYFQPLCGQAVASILPVLLHPKSRGEIMLKSSNPMDHPIINPRYYSDHRDIQTMIEAMRLIEKIVTSRPFSDIGATLNPTPVAGCEMFKFGSGSYWECYLRHLTLTTYHPIGTCQMGPGSSKQAVVDDQLRVHGVKRLRVIDASVMPTLVGANINAVTVMIAEKGSQMIRRFWQLQKYSCRWEDIFIGAFFCDVNINKP